MIHPEDVTACLVTRGDQPEAMQRILDSLIFEDVVIWDNSVRHDRKCAGRYYAIPDAGTPIIFFQDDDVIVPRETQEALLREYQPGVMVANWGHGSNPDGYDDLPLVCGGAIVDRHLPWEALDRYLNHYPCDDGFLYEADFVAGVLYEHFRHVYLPFEIDMDIAQHPSRLCHQPFQKALKYEITERARAVRDGRVPEGEAYAPLHMEAA